MKRCLMILVAALTIACMFGCDSSNVVAQDSEAKVETTEEKETYTMYTPSEEKITSGEDYYSVEKLEPGNYTFPNCNFCLKVTNPVDLETDGKLYSLSDIDGKILATVDNPVVVSDGECYYLVGETIGRMLEVYKFDQSNIYDVVELYADLPDRVTRCGKGSLEACTLGEYMENNYYCYGLFVEGKEMATVKTTVNLDFNWDEGAAVGNDGNLYYLFFSNDPWEIKVVRIDTPEKMKVETLFSQDGYADDGESYSGFFSTEAESGKKYFVAIDSNAILARNQLPGYNHVSQIEVSKNNFKVLEIIPENFESFKISYGSDALVFELDCLYYLNDYTFEYRVFDIGVEKNYLSVVIPASELTPYCVEVGSYKAAKKMIQNLNEFLEDYESENVEFICSQLVKYDWILEEDEILEYPWGVQEFINKNALFWSTSSVG